MFLGGAGTKLESEKMPVPFSPPPLFPSFSLLSTKKLHLDLFYSSVVAVPFLGTVPAWLNHLSVLSQSKCA